MKRRPLGLIVASAIVAVACGGGEIVIGDDTSLAGPDGGDPSVLPESGTPDSASPNDAGTDTSMPPQPPGACAIPNECQKNGTACRAKDTTGLTCKADEFCCAQTCPTLSPPAPTFCDGGPYAALYGTGGCIVGYGCSPVTCAAAGGSCVALAPGVCPSNKVGDATKYSCGGGLGTQCCLP